MVATGTGGIGKTSLVRQYVAKFARQRFPDGSAWLDATRLTQDLDRVCRRLGWADTGQISPDDAVDWLARALHGRCFLVIVDNVDCSGVQLRHIPRLGDPCRVLVTSRVRALHDDLDAVRIDLGAWSTNESLEYLRVRCERLRGIEDNELIPLLDFVGKLPLGVNLVSSYMLKQPALGPKKALAKLQKQPVAMLEKYRGQHPGLIATFESTYSDLDDRARFVLQALTVCAQQTRAEVVGAVSGVDDIEDVLDELHGRSLVEWDEGEDGGDVPWKLHDVVRMFVAEQPGLDRFELAHVQWAENHIAEHADARDHLEFGKGADEIAVGLQRLVAAKDFERAMDLYRPLEGHFTRMGKYLRAMGLNRQIMGAAPPDSPWAAESMSNLGALHLRIGQAATSAKFNERALKVAQGLCNVDLEMKALGNLGISYDRLGESLKAIECFDRIVSIARRIDRRESEAKALGNLGSCHQGMGDIPHAIKFYEMADAIFSENSLLEGRASVLGNLGMCYRRLSDLPKAIDHHERALEIERSLGRRDGQAQQLGNLGACYLDSDDAPRAIGFLRDAAAMFEELEILDALAVTLGNLGVCHRMLGETATAIQYHERGFGIEQRMNLFDNMLTTLENLRLCYECIGDVERTSNCLRLAEVIEKSRSESQRPSTWAPSITFA